MPATSKSQANLFKMVVAYKKGKLNQDTTPITLWNKVKKIAKGISNKDAKDLTKLKEHVVYQIKKLEEANGL